MKRLTISGSLAVLITIIASFIINSITVKGAQSGGSYISKEATIEATYNSDSYYWHVYPYSLLIATAIGIIVFIIAYLLIPKDTTK